MRAIRRPLSGGYGRDAPSHAWDSYSRPREQIIALQAACPATWRPPPRWCVSDVAAARGSCARPRWGSPTAGLPPPDLREFAPRKDGRPITRRPGRLTGGVGLPAGFCGCSRRLPRAIPSASSTSTPVLRRPRLRARGRPGARRQGVGLCTVVTSSTRSRQRPIACRVAVPGARRRRRGTWRLASRAEHQGDRGPDG